MLASPILPRMYRFGSLPCYAASFLLLRGQIMPGAPPPRPCRLRYLHMAVAHRLSCSALDASSPTSLVPSNPLLLRTLPGTWQRSSSTAVACTDVIPQSYCEEPQPRMTECPIREHSVTSAWAGCGVRRDTSWRKAAFVQLQHWHKTCSTPSIRAWGAGAAEA